MERLGGKQVGMKRDRMKCRHTYIHIEVNSCVAVYSDFLLDMERDVGRYNEAGSDAGRYVEKDR